MSQPHSPSLASHLLWRLLALAGLAAVPSHAHAGDAVVSELVAGGGHTCVVTTAGAVLCWGSNAYGQVGVPQAQWLAQPSTVHSLDAGVVAVAAGSEHTCALTDAGAVKCWGRNHRGQLGAHGDNSAVPVDVMGMDGDVLAIGAGEFHTCAVKTDGSTWCWGENIKGQTGIDPSLNGWSAVPSRAQSLRAAVTDVTGGTYHSCALTRAGGVHCWGGNRHGQLGHPGGAGADGANSIPQAVTLLHDGVGAIDLGRHHSCAAMQDGTARCWGDNRSGQLGGTDRLGAGDVHVQPVTVDALGGDVRALSVGSQHSCALLASGAMQCWGSNQWAQLGNTTNAGTTVPNPEPLDVAAPDAATAAIAAGRTHTCAVSSNGAVRCWGSNNVGQLGNPIDAGTVTLNPVPLPVTDLGGAAAVAQTIDFPQPPTLALTAPLLLDAAASSGGAVVFDTWTPNVCTVSGNVLTAAPGARAGMLCGVRASQPGSGGVAAAMQQRRVVRLTRRDVLTVHVMEMHGGSSVSVLPLPAAGGPASCTLATSPCTFVYTEGDAEDLRLRSTPGAGAWFRAYRFDCAGGATDPHEASLTLSGDAVCVVEFANDGPRHYRLAADVVAGQGSVDPATRDVPYGPEARLTITPDPGWRVDRVTGDTCNPERRAGALWVVPVVVADCRIAVRFVEAPDRLGILDGSDQEATVATAFVQPLRVRVTDAGGQPLVGVAVSFVAHAGVSGAGAVLSALSATTDASGIASVTATANGAAGRHHVSALLGNGAAAEPVAFSLANVDGDAELQASVDANRDHAHYRDALIYDIRIRNTGGRPLDDVEMAVTLAGALSNGAVQWKCLSPTSGCRAEGFANDLADIDLDLDVGEEATWWMRALPHPASPAAAATVTLDAHGGGVGATAIHQVRLSLLRDDFEPARSD